MAKQKRLRFPFNNKMFDYAFDLIYVEPFSTTTLDGFKYFLTVVDDATRATWVFSHEVQI